MNNLLILAECDEADEMILERYNELINRKYPYLSFKRKSKIMLALYIKVINTLLCAKHKNFYVDMLLF